MQAGRSLSYTPISHPLRAAAARADAIRKTPNLESLHTASLPQLKGLPMNAINRLLIGIVPALFLAACGGGNDDDLDDRLDLADPKVRVLHAVPLAPEVSLFRNDVAVGGATDLAYKDATNYFDVSTATQKWDLRTTGSPALTVGSVTFDARRGNRYTLVAVPDAGSATEVVLIDDPYNKSIASDNARVRVFNAAFNAASLDVYLTAPGADLATATPTFAAVGYKTALPASGSDSVQLEGSNYQLRMTTAGTKTVVFDAQVSLARNADWLLVPVPASVTPNATKVLVVQTDSSTPATELSTTP